MPRSNFLCAILCLWGLFCQAQGIKGKLSNSAGEALPYVTIYVGESKIGTNSNLEGIYSLKLANGIYQVVFQSIDYQTISKTIEINNEWVELNLVMAKQLYELKEFKVSGKRENPANFIMRKAIGAAPYYRRQVLAYTARVYVKGTGRIDECPSLLKGFIKKQGLEVGRSYTTESINELSFSQPSTYREKVISLKSSMPFNGAPEPMRMARGSWYDTRDDEQISPLSPQAFTYYKFTLEGSFFENGREVNKIRVEPKRRGNGTYKGTLYIIEDLWCLHSCVLSYEETGMDVSIKTTYKPMAAFPFVFMPATYDITAQGNFLGVKGSFRYLASVNNYQIKLNPNVDHQWLKKLLDPPTLKQMPLVRTEKKQAKQTKNQEQIAALMAKEKLNKAEMLKLASKMKKEAERNTQEIRDINDSTEIVIDSLALKRDSIYWEQNRPVPLLKDEQEGFIKSDTANKIKRDTLHNVQKLGARLGTIVIGSDSILGKTKMNYFAYKGFLNGLKLNAVEGVSIENSFAFGNTKSNAWRYQQKIRIPLERPLLQSIVEINYKFNPSKFGIVYLKGGSYLTDYNSKGISAFTDAFQLLLFQTNYSRLYMQEFVSTGIQMEIANGMNLVLNAMAANRYSLDNLQRYQLQEGKGMMKANSLPQGLATEPSYRTYQIGGALQYKLFQTYKMRANKKIYLKNEWPSLNINYTLGMGKSAMQFQKIALGIDQSINLRHWLNLNYTARLGMFPMNSDIHFADWQHFSGNQSFLYDGDDFYRFKQLPYYDYSTKNAYQSLMLQLNFKRLVLRQLPYINLFDFRETIYFNYLRTQDHPLYYEAGYRINPMGGTLNLSFNFHFIDNKYKGAGMSLAIWLR